MIILRVLGYYGMAVCVAKFCLQTGIQNIPSCAQDADDREPVDNHAGPSPSVRMPPAQRPPVPSTPMAVPSDGFAPRRLNPGAILPTSASTAAGSADDSVYHTPMSVAIAVPAVTSTTDPSPSSTVAGSAGDDRAGRYLLPIGLTTSAIRRHGVDGFLHIVTRAGFFLAESRGIDNSPGKRARMGSWQHRTAR
ncbi:uncharacterized protein L3040_007070 [Drepanopeziza brunnea f. sp. 'multigermtubi']|uniref:uncharacterized protein n=1 Tax=Drepanopeziza brunnea f. sp. 'multigermtubi' TaxID=698441 RepID=UPI0023841990|nr:hypothetical protein L3040_007070 [Drepanopeziza brunnea f. sp. 'multigermtubi']